MRLRTAIQSGKLDVPVDTIRQDNQCVFGKWLYGPTIAPTDKALRYYTMVKDLHAEFHKTAARVADLAVGGKQTDPRAMMSAGGPYVAVSDKLVHAITDWKKGAK